MVLHTGPISRAQWRWTAVLHAGTGARLAGLSALEQDGLTGWARDETHVLVASGRSVPPLVGLIVHTTRLSDVDSGSSGHRPASAGPQVGWPKVRQGGTPRFASEQLETGLPASWGDASVPGRCPATPVVRSTVDAARWESSSRRAGGIVLAVVQQRLATPSQLGRVCATGSVGCGTAVRSPELSSTPRQAPTRWPRRTSHASSSAPASRRREPRWWSRRPTVRGASTSSSTCPTAGCSRSRSMVFTTRDGGASRGRVQGRRARRCRPPGVADPGAGVADRSRSSSPPTGHDPGGVRPTSA